MEELKISFTENQVESVGEIQSINWDALLPKISEYIRLRSTETIEGLIVNESEIRVVIGRKRLRAPKKVKSEPVNTEI